jgi:hypothetical protein
MSDSGGSMSLISMDFAAAGRAHDRAEDAFSYHQRRAEEELRIAQQADLPAVRRFHYHLAALHLDRAHSDLATLKQVA